MMCNPTGNHYDRLVRSSVTVFDLILDTRFSLAGIRYLKQHLARHAYDILYCFNNKAASSDVIHHPRHECQNRHLPRHRRKHQFYLAVIAHHPSASPGLPHCLRFKGGPGPTSCNCGFYGKKCPRQVVLHL
ncbi:MAG: hypothetical protein R2860_10245 [Desulfobacterales bacterium]